MYEELDAAIFEEINNVIATNNLLSPAKDFVFDEKVYYRIYAERQHVEDVEDQQRRLAQVAIIKFYAPMVYWLTKLSPQSIAGLMQAIPLTSKSSHVRMLCRLAMLFGDCAVKWMSDGLQKAWKTYAQRPDYYFAFNKMIADAGDDRRLAALQLSPRSRLEIPGESQPISIKDLLSRPKESANFLSRVCMRIFDGDMTLRSLSRTLDLISHGADMEQLGPEVCTLLPKN